LFCVAAAAAGWTIGVWLHAGVLCAELSSNQIQHEPAARAVERHSVQSNCKGVQRGVERYFGLIVVKAVV
jgi:hypothetical protein